MKLLRCKICKNEIDIIKNDRSVNKIIKCRKCGFSNNDQKPMPEVVIIKRKRNNFNG